MIHKEDTKFHNQEDFRLMFWLSCSSLRSFYMMVLLGKAALPAVAGTCEPEFCNFWGNFPSSSWTQTGRIGLMLNVKYLANITIYHSMLTFSKIFSLILNLFYSAFCLIDAFFQILISIWLFIVIIEAANTNSSKTMEIWFSWSVFTYFHWCLIIGIGMYKNYEKQIQNFCLFSKGEEKISSFFIFSVLLFSRFPTSC